MCLGVRQHSATTFNFHSRIKCFTALPSHRLCNTPDECVSSREVGVFFSLFLSLLFSLYFSLSFPPHGGDTTVPSALHLFNKDLLCSKTLIQSSHRHAKTHTSRLRLVTGREREKKVRDVGLGALGALFVNSHSNEKRERPPCGTRTFQYGYNYKLVIQVFMVKVEA